MVRTAQMRRSAGVRTWRSALPSAAPSASFCCAACSRVLKSTPNAVVPTWGGLEGGAGRGSAASGEEQKRQPPHAATLPLPLRAASVLGVPAAPPPTPTPSTHPPTTSMVIRPSSLQMSTGLPAAAAGCRCAARRAADAFMVGASAAGGGAAATGRASNGGRDRTRAGRVI